MVSSPGGAQALDVGRTFGRYELVRKIESGGMATVYLAQMVGPHGFEKWVAVKVIHPHLAHDPNLVSMFLDEARVASRIRHTNVCAILDLGVEDDVPYLVMELLSGVPLSAALRRGWRREDVPPELAARVLADAARGLHAAHELRGDDGELLNVVHRDVSPQNVFVLHDGAVKVLDFGIARARNRESVTRAGELKGKVGYMAPEMLRSQGRTLDRRADVWALGVVLWEAVVGKRLFHTEDRIVTGSNVLRQSIPRPRELRRDIPEALERVVLGALERDPDRRTPTAAAFADALERWLYSTGRPYGSAQVAEWVGRHFGPDRGSDETPLTASGVPVLAGAGHGGRVTEPVAFAHSSAPPASREATSHVSELTTKPLFGLQGLDDSGYVDPVDDERRQRRIRRAAIVALAIACAVVLGSLAGVLLAGAGGDAPPRTSRAPRAAAEPPRSVREAARPALPGAAVEAVTDATARAGGLEQPVARGETAPDDVAGAAPPSDEQPAARRTARRRAARPVAAASARTATRAPASATEPATSAGPGALNLLAIPQAIVTWQGRTLGRTPLLEQPLPPGRHNLVLRPVDGGAERTISIDIRSGQLTHRRVRLEGS